MYPRLIATVCTPGYLPGLEALLNSIYAYHRDKIPVAVFHEMPEAEAERIRSHPIRPELAGFGDLSPPPAGAWEAKQCIFQWALGRGRCVYLLDADIVITSNIDDVFRSAEDGHIVSSHDGRGGVHYGEEYATYSRRIVGEKFPYINSGALCLDVEKHWDAVALWAFTSAYSAFSPGGGAPLHLPGHGDQGTLNAVLATLGKYPEVHVLPEADWCDSTIGCRLEIVGGDRAGTIAVKNLKTGNPQRLVHSSGPKWWTPEGAKHLRRMGDKLACFEHFHGLDPTSLPAAARRVPAAPVAQKVKCAFLVAVCSCQRFSARREAVRNTWMRHLPPEVEAFFFAGRPPGVPEVDLATLDAPDDYASLPSKVRGAFRHALDNYDFDFLFKCDDDTYAVPSRLGALASMGADFVGGPELGSAGYASGGAGYLISRRCARFLAEAHVPLRGAEDVAFSKLVRGGDFTWASDHRLQSGHRVRPAADNPAITAHYCSPELMLKIDAAFGVPAAYACFVAKHRHWEGLLQLNLDGSFLGGGDRPDGRWEMDGTALTLNWYHWPPESLSGSGDGAFVSENLTLTRLPHGAGGAPGTKVANT